MSISASIKNEIEQVQLLGDSIGYGHLMALASALWRKRLKESGLPTNGAFVPMISKQMSDELRKEIEMYDNFVQ